MKRLSPRVRGWALAMFLALPVLVTGCASIGPPPGISAVAPFDLARYEGRWYEIARLDHSFERGMTDVSVVYSLQPDGSVRVGSAAGTAGPTLA